MTATLATVLQELQDTGVRTAWTLSAVAGRPYALLDWSELERVAIVQDLDVTLQDHPQTPRAVVALRSCDLVAYEVRGG